MIVSLSAPHDMSLKCLEMLFAILWQHNQGRECERKLRNQLVAPLSTWKIIWQGRNPSNKSDAADQGIDCPPCAPNTMWSAQFINQRCDWKILNHPHSTVYGQLKSAVNWYWVGLFCLFLKASWVCCVSVFSWSPWKSENFLFSFSTTSV